MKAQVSHLYQHLDAIKGQVGAGVRMWTARMLMRSAALSKNRDYQAFKILNAKLNESEYELGRTRLRSMPTLMRVGATRRCNLRCITCGVGHRTKAEEEVYRSEGRMDLSMEDYRLVASEVFPSLARIEFSQNGEGLLLGDRFVEMLRLANAYGVEITVSTNGMLFDKGVSATLVGLEHLAWVTFSLDAADKETLERIRIGVRLETVVKHIRDLVAVRRSPHLPAIRIHFTAMKSNLHELPKVVDLAADVGAEEVSAAYVYVNPYVPLEESLYFAKEAANKMFAYAAARAQERGIRFVGPPAFGKGLLGYSSFKCLSAWSGPSVVPGGFLMPCCVLYRKDHFMGHAREGFKKVWNNARYRKLRRAFVSGAPLAKKCWYCNLHPQAFDPDKLASHVTEEVLDSVLATSDVK